jgi:Photosynthetic reaction centre cytochrome C subunit
MRLNVPKMTVLTLAFAALVGASIYAQGQQPPPQGQQAARKPENLQVLPKDWTYQQVQQQMRGFTAALGVECSHCHVGGQQERAKDDNPKKAIARKMLQMTAAINKDLLKDVGEPAANGTAKVTCFTCHRGAIKPLNAPGGGGH